jgi:hypothetical protein
LAASRRAFAKSHENRRQKRPDTVRLSECS